MSTTTSHDDTRELRRDAPPPFIQRGESDPYFQERVKALRAKIEHKIDSLNIKVVAMTSSIAGEGKTLTSVSLAMNLAKTGRKKVILIDADLRKSDLARGMDIEPLPGLGEFLTGTAPLKQIVRKTEYPGLYVIPGGAPVAKASELLAGDTMKGLLNETRDKFDVVLLDTPPVLPVSDTLSLRDQVDGFLFLFRASYTPHHMFQNAMEEIGERKVLGVVINAVEPNNQRHYQYYYGKYYQE